jgi:hypothetical protein
MGVKFATVIKQRTQIASKNGVLRRMFGEKGQVTDICIIWSYVICTILQVLFISQMKKNVADKVCSSHSTH